MAVITSGGIVGKVLRVYPSTLSLIHIYVSPGEMVAARDVIELIAKVAITVVEVDVEEQVGESDGQNDQHSASQQRSVVAGGCGQSCPSASHGEEE